MEIDSYTGEVDPFSEESPPTVQEILDKLESLERQKAYLLELLTFYEPTRDISAHL